MSRFHSIKDTQLENNLFLNRIIAAFIAIMLLTSGLIIRLIHLQIAGHEHYASLAKDNSIKIYPIVPTRGMIYDRHGNILAENTPSYSLEIIPEKTTDIDDTLLRLQKLLNIPDEKIDLYQKQRKRQKRFTSTPLLLSMSDEEIAKFAVNRPFFSGVDIRQRLVRHYPYNELTAHVVGYVGRINEAELKTLPMAEYQGSTHVGKLGIESSYETELHGKTGYAEIETNVQARPLNTLNETDAVQGANLYLTLDIDLQKTAYDALGAFNGAVVAIDIKTGGVLTFVSRPSFDPNPFIAGIASDAYQALQSSENQPLYNRALRGLYPPGSTLKPFVALAGLEHNTVTAAQRFFCPGYFQLPGVEHQYRCWKKTGHDWVNLNKAITESCDVYFYQLASKLGIDDMHNFLQKFGFGEKTGIDLAGEKTGLLPSREWKFEQKKQSWYPGETLITGIGQGSNQVTPLQLARATATLANKGVVVTPFLVNKIISATETRPGPEVHKDIIALKQKNVDSIVAAMVDVVNSERGTANDLKKDVNYLIAGKTGTAQVRGIKQNAKYDENAIEFKYRDHALFIAFAPADDPKIAVAVIAENGGHGGSIAAPIAAKVIKQYLKDTNEN
ncbi:MAG: penicillin-binding protein 2 [Methylococcaceae bacterium]|nr:penicillin-binding protein 2 [Methylococcaceae bacterium]MDD1607139.1 penicillin-binding protein 2 [Methylococcaceae bacterium]